MTSHSYLTMTSHSHMTNISHIRLNNKMDMYSVIYHIRYEIHV